MNDKEKKDLALSKLVLIVLGGIGLLLILWLGWLNPTKSKTTVSSFAECTQAGNPVQESYPEVCVSKDGKRFTNPGQHIQDLTIREWAATALITGVSDAYYVYDAAAGTVLVSTKTLDAAAKKIQGCTSNMHGNTYERLLPGAPKDDGSTWTKAELSNAAKVGNYYYQQKSTVETLCMPSQKDTNVKTVQDIKARIESGMRGLQPQR